MLDRLTLTETRMQGLAAALENLANLPDPVGNVVRGQTLPNGLRLRQSTCPWGWSPPSTRPPQCHRGHRRPGPQERQRRHPARRDCRGSHQRRPVTVLREPYPVGLPSDAVQTVDQYGREGVNA